MATIEELPDWLRVASSDIEVQRTEQIQQEMRRLTPSKDTLLSLGEAARNLVRTVHTIAPDVVIFTGRSALLSETLFRTIDPEQPVAGKVSIDVTEAFYDLADDPTSKNLPRAKQLLAKACPTVTAGQKVVIIDDYVGSGSKSEKFLRSLDKLGLAGAHFLGFSGYEGKKYAPNVHVGIQSNTLTDYLSNLAFMVSLTQRKPDEVGSYLPHMGEIQKQTSEAMQRITTSLKYQQK